MINSKLIQELNEKKNDLASNFKAEVIALELIKRGVSPQKIFIVSNGVVGKTAVKDIEDISLKRSMYTMEDYVYITTNRTGIYDTLPEGLFHENFGHNQRDAKANSKKIRKEQELARQFFLPFEILINKYNTGIFRNGDLGIYENLYSVLAQFSNNWAIFKSLDGRRAALFLYVIPILNQIRVNYNLVGNFLSLFFDVPITVTLKQKIMTQVVRPELSLSESQFGLDSVLGGISSEIIPVIHITIGPVEDEKLASFLPKSKNDSLLDELSSWIFDCQIPVERELLAVKNESNKRPANYYLGTNTFF